MFDYNDLGWRYWLVTAVLLTYGVSGDPIGFILAIGLTVIQLIHFIFNVRNITSFPVQVRIWYLILLIISLPAPMQMLFWIPCIGTWAQVIFGYCTMARFVSLLPWNRTKSLSMKLVIKTFFSRPVKGSVKQVFSES
ncbi:MAG: hypothetical protein QNL62_21060 [Gammaproteobacteria bacterium]|nr:hypothetical protein [Gammaproteobacteria bacterium]